MKRTLTLIAIIITWLTSAALPQNVTWAWETKKVTDTEGEIIWTAKIEEGWHIYGNDMSDVKGIATNPTTITVNPTEGLVLEGEMTPSVAASKHYDSIMEMEIPWWEGTVTFTQKFRLDGVKGARITGDIHYMACNATACTPPTTEEYSVDFGDVTSLPDTGTNAAMQDTDAAAASSINNAVWAPVDEKYNEEVAPDVDNMSLWMIFILGFLGGLVAVATPCVWPMIPMTVSFFLKTSKDRAKAMSNAVVYGLSIIVIFVGLGLLITAIFDASKLNELSTSAVFNLIFFALLVIFAISFFGAFDIKLPAKWSNALDAKAETTSGYLSIFFMAFTLVLVSFSCTGPIIGTLLVEVASDGIGLGAAVGMGGFAAGLALPFTLFAVFPSFMQTMPKSGGWLNSVKVVLGFIELILSLKFLSVADLAYGWRILDREVFVAIWIVLFILLGLYLLGKLRFPHDSPSQSTSVLGFFLALVPLSFAVYLVPGLWGAPLKTISAFAPPMFTQDFNLAGAEYKEFEDFDEGMAYAKSQGKPVFVDFTGYGCVNCRKMEMAVFNTPDVRRMLEDDYVVVRLYVDEKKKLEQPIVVTEDNGKQTTLKTVGDKWSYLQRHKFKINSQPYYVLLDENGEPLNSPRQYDENVPAFVDWLNTGLSNFAK